MAPIGSVGNRPISFALIGAGSAGRGVFHQSRQTADVSCDVICDCRIERALACAGAARPSKIVSTLGEIADVVRTGQLAICEDAQLAAEAPGIDVFFNASTAIDLHRKLQLWP